MRTCAARPRNGRHCPRAGRSIHPRTARTFPRWRASRPDPDASSSKLLDHERVKQTDEIRARRDLEPRPDLFRRASPADPTPCFEHQHPLPRPREVRRAGQAVVTCPDHDHVQGPRASSAIGAGRPRTPSVSAVRDGCCPGIGLLPPGMRAGDRRGENYCNRSLTARSWWLAVPGNHVSLTLT